MTKKIELKITVLLIIIFIFCFSQPLFAQENGQENAQEIAQENGEANQNTVYINAGRLDYESEKTLLSGGITIRKGDTLINALKGELFRDEQKMILEDEIEVEYPDGRVSSRMLTAYLESEEYIFENEAVLNYLLSGGDEMLLKSNYLKIFANDNSFEAEDNVEIDYDQQKFKGDKADYDGETELLHLTGNVEIEEDDDWIRSDRATFNLKEGEEGYSAEGNVEIRMFID